MAQATARFVSPRDDGNWDNKAANASRASSVHDTQAEAVEAAKTTLRNQGGGELSIQASNGEIREKVSVPGKQHARVLNQKNA